MENKENNSQSISENNQKFDQNERTEKGFINRITKTIALVLCFVLTFVGGYFSRYIFDRKEISKTNDVVRLIEKFGYVLDEDGNLRDLTPADYAKALADGLLDQHSEYYTKEEYESLKSEKSGNRTGFGFSIYVSEDVPPVINKVMGNSPADKGGFRVGDMINSANIEGEESVHFTNSQELSDFLSICPSDKKVTFNISRGSENVTIELQRDFYKTSYVIYFDSERKMSLGSNGVLPTPVEYPQEKMDLPADTALIKILNFEGAVALQLNVALQYMQQQGRTKLILDLRDNGGGYMDDLCDVAEQLIYNGGKKTLIAYARGKNDSESFYIKSEKNNSFITKISVLANDGTASASECLIGAMLHYGERFSLDNLVVEKKQDGVARTYGKGIMQTTYLLLDGSAMKLTTAKVLWPDKTTCIHLKGILPNPENATEKGESAVLRAVAILQD